MGVLPSKKGEHMTPIRHQPVTGLVLAAFILVALVCMPAHAASKATMTLIPGMTYNANASLADNLKSLTGKNVTVTLDSGKTLGGILKKVGNQLIHIEKINGKEFFDALIRIDKITAVEARFREIKRK
jgi:hypothetical protein